MGDCSNHKKDLFGHENMKKVAVAIGDLHYEALAELLGRLSIKLYKDSIKDRVERPQLAYELIDASDRIRNAADHIKKAWEISKPFMGKENKPD